MLSQLVDRGEKKTWNVLIIIKASLKDVCGFITPNNVLDIRPLRIFYPNISGE